MISQYIKLYSKVNGCYMKLGIYFKFQGGTNWHFL